jgi:hypothetical protein
MPQPQTRPPTGPPPRTGNQLRRYDGHGIVRVGVYDSGDGVPVSPTGGTGPLLVTAPAGKWGVGERSPGKVAWAAFAK